MSYNITVEANPIAGGTVSISGTTDSEGKYIEGTEVTITATPNSGYEFISWTDIDSGSVYIDQTYSFIVDKDYILSAGFSIITIRYTLKTKSNDDAYGRISVVGANYLSTDSEGYSVYSMLKNTQIQLYAVPMTGYIFSQWSTGLTDQSYIFAATQDLTISAIFIEPPVTPVEGELVELTTDIALIGGTIVGTFKPISSEGLNYAFYWGTQQGSQTNSWTPSTLTTSEFKLEVTDEFENLIINSASSTFYLRVTGGNNSEAFYQNDIPFTVSIPDNYKPTVTLGDFKLTRAFNGLAIAGYTVYDVICVVDEVPSNNSADITNVVPIASLGYCELYNLIPNSIIRGTTTESNTNYNLTVSAIATDSRGRATTGTTNDLLIYGYHLPDFELISLTRCDSTGIVQENPDLNTYCKILFNLIISNITGNELDIGNIELKINNILSYNATLVSANQYQAIIGNGTLDPDTNYYVTVTTFDTIMDQLDIPHISFISSLSGKLPWSLLDDLNGVVGAAVGIEASQDDMFEVALDTSFKDDITLHANTYEGNNIKIAEMSSYDLVHNAVRVYEGDHIENGSYGNIIRTMTGQEYKVLQDNREIDPYTLYFLSSPIGDQ